MKIYPLAVAISCLVATGYSMQAGPPPSATQGDLSIVAQISKDLNTRKLKVGDKVSAKVIQDALVRGRILVPRDSKLVGHVAEVVSPSKDDPESRLAVVFDRIELSGGKTSLIHGVIQAIGRPLPDPALETIMGSSSSPYAGGQNGRPVNTPAGQSNTPTPIITSGRTMSGAGALEERERELEGAGVQTQQAGPPGGALSSASRGVFGLPGLFLAGSRDIPCVVSVGHNVELKSGTQVVLRLHGGLLSQSD
jgi:hypothetical protein